MLSSLLRPKKARKRVAEHSPFSSPYVDQSSPAVARHQRMARHASADFTETEQGDEATEEEDDEENEADADDDENHPGEELEDDDEDGDEDSPLLPLFSAAHLGKQFCC